MKRHGAGKNTDVRKRTETEVARPFGPLTDIEIEDIRQAYRGGCKGEMVIGMRGDERVITMLVPAQSTPDTAEAQIQQSITKLRAMGCERYVRVRRR